MAEGGDIGSYIASNKTKLTEDNYTQMDSFVFSELAYMKLEKLEGSGKSYTVSKAADLLLKAENNSNPDRVAFLESLKNSERYKDCVIRNIQTENTNSQWAALTVDFNKEGTASAIAFRGTNGTTLGWEEDFQLYYDIDGTEAQRLSTEYLKNSDSDRIILTGHSKGGNDAISAYVSNDQPVREKVVRIDNFDGPGVNPEYRLINGNGYKELGDKLYSYYPEDSVVGQLLIDKPGHSLFIPTDTKGHTEGYWIFDSHDPFSWRIENGEFVQGQQSYISIILDDLVDYMSVLMPNYTREQLANIIIHLGIPAVIAGDGGGKFGLDYYINHLTRFDDQTLSAFLELKQIPYIICSFIIAGSAVIRKNVFNFTLKALEYSLEKVILCIDTSIKKLSHYIKNIYTKVKEGAKEAWPAIEEKFNQIKSWFSSGKTNAQGITTANFAVNLNVLSSCSNEFSSLSKQLSSLSSTVSKIQHHLLLSTSIGNLFKLEQRENSLSRLSDRTKSFDKALDEVVKKYDKAEKSVKGLVT